MKKLLFALILITCSTFFPGQVSAAPVLIQSCSNATFSASNFISCTLGSSVGAHHHLIVSAVTYDNFCPSTTGMADTLGILLPARAIGSAACSTLSGHSLSLQHYCVETKTTTGSDTISMQDNTGSGTSGVYLIVAEYSGLFESGAAGGDCAAELDGTSTNNGTTGPSIGTNNVTTANANDLIIASAWYYGPGTTTTLTAPGSYTSEVYYNTCTGCTNQVSHMFTDRIVSATGTYSGTFTEGTTSTNWLVVQAALKVASSAASYHHRPQVIHYHLPSHGSPLLFARVAIKNLFSEGD